MNNLKSPTRESNLSHYREALDLLKMMKRTGIRITDALDLLRDILAAFEAYEEERAAEDSMPFPMLMYGVEAIRPPSIAEAIPSREEVNP